MPPDRAPGRALGFQEWLVARSDASQHAGQSGATRKLAGWLRIDPGCRVLDLGCGSAKSALALASTHRARLVGIDRSALSLERAISRRRREGGVASLALVQGDGLALPVRAASFDVVLVEAVAYAAPLRALLAELARVLVPGGRLGLVDIARRRDRSPPRDEFQRLLGEPTLNLLTLDEWVGEVRGGGLEVERAEVFPIRQELATVRAELGDWLRSLPRQLAWLARSQEARRLFFANYRVGLDRGIEGCLVAAVKPEG